MREQRLQARVVRLHVNQHATILTAQLTHPLQGKYTQANFSLMLASAFVDRVHRQTSWVT